MARKHAKNAKKAATGHTTSLNRDLKREHPRKMFRHQAVTMSVDPSPVWPKLRALGQKLENTEDRSRISTTNKVLTAT